MKKVMFGILAFALLSLPGSAQQTVKQSGNVSGGHSVVWVAPGIIGDGGAAINGILTSLGVTNNGGPGVCVNSAATTGPYNQICISATTNGGTKLSSYAYNGATSPGFVLDINGTIQFVPLTVGPFVGNDLLCASGTTGAYKDCGATAGAAGIPVISNGAAATPVYGTALVVGGGTGNTTLTNHGVLIGAGTSAVTQLGAASSGTVLGGVTGADPAFTAQPTLGANGGTGGQITLNGSTSGSSAIRVPAAAGTSTIFQLPNTNGTAGDVLRSDGSGNTSWTGGIQPPGGRLTLQSGFPVQASTQSAKTTIFYTCHVGIYAPIPASSVFTNFPIPSCEISVGLATANVLSAGNYDVFLINNAGTMALCVNGNSWTSGSRTASTLTHGANTLTRTNGFWVNSSTITNCWGGAAGTTNLGSIAAGNALAIGSFEASANGQVSLDLQPTATAGGPGAWCALQNYYNRVPVTCINRDATAAWNHTSAGANTTCNSAGPGAGAGNRIKMLDALGDNAWSIDTSFSIVSTSATVGMFAIVGAGLDSATVISGTSNGGVLTQQVTTPDPDPNSVANKYGLVVSGRFVPPDPSALIGQHFLQCMQFAAKTAVQFNGSDYMWFAFTNLM